MKKEEKIKKLKKIIKGYGYEVIHLTNVSPKKLEDTIKIFKKQFHFEDVILILRGKTTSRRIYR